MGISKEQSRNAMSELFRNLSLQVFKKINLAVEVHFAEIHKMVREIYRLCNRKAIENKKSLKTGYRFCLG